LTAAGLIFGPSLTLATELRGGVPDDNSVVLDHGLFRGPNFVADKLACIAKLTGFDIHWKYYPTNRLLSMAAKLELDFIFPMGFSDQRDKFLIRSEYIFLSVDDFVYRGSKPDFSDKAHIHIGVREGSTQLNEIIANHFRNIEVGHSYENLLKMLGAGRVDAVVIPDMVLATFATTFTEPLKTEAFDRRQVGFYVGKDWPPDQLATLNAAIVKCRD